jgi:hypothetical protein
MSASKVAIVALSALFLGTIFGQFGIGLLTGLTIMLTFAFNKQPT